MMGNFISSLWIMLIKWNIPTTSFTNFATDFEKFSLCFDAYMYFDFLSCYQLLHIYTIKEEEILIKHGFSDRLFSMHSQLQ